MSRLYAVFDSTHMYLQRTRFISLRKIIIALRARNREESERDMGAHLENLVKEANEHGTECIRAER